MDKPGYLPVLAVPGAVSRRRSGDRRTVVDVDAPLADDEVLHRHAALLEVLAERHGLSALALGSAPGELVAGVREGRTYLDVAVFELEVIDAVGRDVHVTPAGAPGAHIRAPLTAAPAA